ncbi:hypothetical protein JWG44_21585 [Leptospira sp. 201903071]|uniref:hypothetical protein n=1 Tax=Leptospira ainazelensis TaxID=2810034 RepID=UPI0019632A33|nr:hypothetical protein [Leptospira ainazelensis]MBM9502849.1 hypothetical protein [Leptospira ainazelensis]
MKTKINTISENDLFGCFPDKGFVYKNPAPEPNIEGVQERLDELLQLSNVTKASVVCIDVYKYSQNELRKLFVIPSVIKAIHKMTIDILIENEAFLFEDIDDPIVADTGDGLICVFPTPIHSISYIMWFEVALRLYNTYHLSPGIREIVGKLSIRYSTSYDSIIKIEDKYYGPAIINASRMISRDRLNRCLIDEYSIDWFTRNFNGIENIIMLSKYEIQAVMRIVCPGESFSKESNLKSIFDLVVDMHWGIKACDIQHIGELKIKETKISIYNLYIQLLAGLMKRPEYEKEDEEVKLSVSIGNSNPIGISENFA